MSHCSCYQRHTITPINREIEKDKNVSLSAGLTLAQIFQLGVQPSIEIFSSPDTELWSFRDPFQQQYSKQYDYWQWHFSCYFFFNFILNKNKNYVICDMYRTVMIFQFCSASSASTLLTCSFNIRMLLGSLQSIVQVLGRDHHQRFQSPKHGPGNQPFLFHQFAQVIF